MEEVPEAGVASEAEIELAGEAGSEEFFVLEEEALQCSLWLLLRA